MLSTNIRLLRLARQSLAFLASTTCLLSPIVAAETPKNVVVFLADDLGWGDVGFHGGVAETPNIDQLASQGVRLNRFYAYPACSPARAAMLTARSPHRYGITGPVRARDHGLPTSENVLTSDFQRAGYQTSLIGKWHLGGADEPERHPLKRGFDHFYGFTQASVDYFEHTSARGDIDWQRDGNTIREEGYATDLLTDEAVRQIENSSSSRPLCMVVSFSAPHSPHQAPESLVAKYEDKLSEREATYAAMVDSLDQGIGRILKALDDKQMADDTVVVFASDNGAMRLGSNGDFLGFKREVYEGGIHVPCVIRAPGVLKPATESEQLCAIHDLFPTLAEATGVELKNSHPLDGVSIWKSLISGQRDSRCVVIAEAGIAVMQDQWKLVKATDGNAELYDLDSDPNESTDLSTGRPDVARMMTRQLVNFRMAVSTDQPFVAEGNDPNPNAGTQEGESLAAAKIVGDVRYGVLTDPRIESSGRGLRLLSAEDINEDGTFAGEATIRKPVANSAQRWYRFHISGLAEDNFEVDQDDLYLKVRFFKDGGKDSLDLIKTRVYEQVVRERTDLKDNDTNESLGHAVWRTYAMDFRTPFAEVDTLELAVGFSHGKGDGKHTEFWVQSMEVEAIEVPEDYQPAMMARIEFPQPDRDSLVSLGGRWFFDPKDGDVQLPEQFDYTNADQLLYETDRFEAPFAGNMTSWLRAGYLDFNGNEVTKDKFKPYAVVITVTDDHLVIRSRNLPNHPTATFPDRWRRLDGNPSYIKEQANTHYVPLVPTVNPSAIAMDAKNSNQALPMGAIGIATNGVIFFNPFDHIFETDAVWRLDRCCGHPSPNQQYHYHKYPVCIKTPWSDEGQRHSGVLGFAFDGFPVYGPYESKGLLAKDDTENPLNDFNLHEDRQRGPHYHVTPGEYPHVIGGYWGQPDPMNGRRRRAPTSN